MNIGNFGAGLSAMYPGMVQGRQNEAQAVLAEMQAQQAQENQQADVVRGKGLMDLFAGGGGQNFAGVPPPQPPMPGQPSMPTGGGPQPQMPQGVAGPAFTPPAGPRPSPAPVQPLGGMDAQPGPVTAPQPSPQSMPAAPAGPGPQTGGEPQLNGVGEQGGRPTIHGGVPNGPLTWQMIGQAIARSNPGAPPQLIAKAIDKFAPMMTQDSQMQWRLLKMQQDMEMLRVKETGKTGRQETREGGLNDRASFMRDLRRQEDASKNQRNEVSNETRMATAGLSAETRKLIADAHEEGANGRLLTTLRARDDWKKLDVESKKEITDMIIEGQRERTTMQQEGQNQRAAGVQEGANQRNQNTVAGAESRNVRSTNTALEVARQRTDLAKWLADGKPITANQARISEKTQTYDSAIKTIDDAVEAVRQGHVEGKDVVGLKGKIRGLAEIGSNISGWSRDGKPDETRRAEFVQKIELLRTTLPKLLTGSAISNKDERARMMNILQGLERGSTKQATFADLQYLKEKLGQLKPTLGANTNQGDIRASRQGVAPATETPALKAMTPQIKAGMDAAIAGGKSRAEVEKFVRDNYGVDPAGTMPEEPAPSTTTRGPR